MNATQGAVSGASKERGQEDASLLPPHRRSNVLSASDPEPFRHAPGARRQGLAGAADSDLPGRNERRQWHYSDCHFHPTNYVQQGRRPEELIADMDALGIRYATMMPIPTNVLSSQPDPEWTPWTGMHHCGPVYYLPPELMTRRTLGADDIGMARAATELYVNTEVDAVTAMRYAQLKPAQQRRLDPMITGLHLGDMHSSSYLLHKLARYPGVFTGVGEITVNKEVVQDLFAGRRQANLDDNAGPLIKLLETCGRIGMPVVLHCDVDLPGIEDSRNPAYLDHIRKLFRHPAVSGTTLVWAHAGGLGRFVNAPAGHAQMLRELLADHAMKHVHIDLSWSVVAERLTQPDETMKEWVALITDHPQRFLFGSDALAPMDGQGWNKTFATYAGLLNGLPDTVRSQLLNENYERLFVKARRKVRAFEKFFLPDAIREMERMPGGRTAPAPAAAAAGSPATPGTAATPTAAALAATATTTTTTTTTTTAASTTTATTALGATAAATPHAVGAAKHERPDGQGGEAGDAAPSVQWMEQLDDGVSLY